MKASIQTSIAYVKTEVLVLGRFFLKEKVKWRLEEVCIEMFIKYCL